MARTKKGTGAWNTALVIALTLVVAVLVNVLSGQLYGRVDLTEHQVNALSDASKEAAAALDGLEVRVYISEDLPDEIYFAPNRPPFKIRGFDQKLRDKIAEYKAYAGNAMKVTYVADDVTEAGKKAKLRAFRGKAFTLSEGGGLQQDEYVLGVTFHYKNAMEVFEAALHPDSYEFEITKRLLRVKDKAEHSLKMKDVLRAGDAVAKATEACDAAWKEAAPDAADDNPLALLSGEATQHKLAAYKSAKASLDAACGGLDDALAKAREQAGRHDILDRVILIADAAAEQYHELSPLLASDDPTAGNAVRGGVQRLGALADATAQEVEDLENSPGRRRIGFVCDGMTFCPFPDATPLIPKELEGALVQKNPILGQLLPAVMQILDQMNATMAQVNRGLFRARGFDIVRVDLDQDIPEDVDAMVVLGPRGELTAYQLYQLDQFVLGGGSLVAFLNPWDIVVQNFNAKGELKPPSMTKNKSNLGELLATWGITPVGELVLEPAKHGQLVLMSFLRQGQRLIPFQSRGMLYPMVPTFDDFDDSDPLVRATTSVTLPFTTALKLEPKPGETITPLIQSSAEAVTVSDPAFPLDPAEQRARVAEQRGGRKLVVAAVAHGKLPSHFAGAEAPAAPTAGDDADKQGGTEDVADPAAEVAGGAQRLDEGEGRVLVVGSNLGLEPLTREAILEGFNLAMISGESMDYIEKFREYQANFQNWSMRVQQVQHTLEDNIQFLSNALDWSIQRDALVELRSKQVVTRPLTETDEGTQTTLKAAAVVLAPVLFLIAGLLWHLRRRARQRKLTL
ncbi:MAG: hypothetical protein CSA66_03755 [Proteobacteria bacterium]|nr:MAG: hypothetical protein CSA66_03755 [Pseudomonadota bacterium]